MQRSGFDCPIEVPVPDGVEGEGDRCSARTLPGQDIDVGLTRPGRSGNRQRERRCGAGRTDDSVAPGQTEKAHPGRVLAGTTLIRPVRLAKRNEIGRIVDPRPVIADGNHASIFEMQRRNGDHARASTAGVLQQFVENIVERSVENAGDFGDRLGRDPGAQLGGGIHGGEAFLCVNGGRRASQSGCAAASLPGKSGGAVRRGGQASSNSGSSTASLDSSSSPTCSGAPSPEGSSETSTTAAFFGSTPPSLAASPVAMTRNRI